MKALFIDLLRLNNDQHGIHSLSAVLNHHGIRTEYLGTRNRAKALQAVARSRPDVLLYSSFSASLPEIQAFDREAKRLGRWHSVIGGPGVTFDHLAVKDSSIDAVCVGEGEDALTEYLLGGFQPVKNIVGNGAGLPGDFFPLVNPDQLPFPDREVIYRTDPLLRDAPSKQIFSGRGCPYRCTYCFNHKFNDLFKDHGPVIRKKSVDYLLEEIRLLQSRYPLSNLHFNDDTFILDKKWFFEFCGRFPKAFPDLTYSCNVRANLLREDVAEALAASHCLHVTWSIESGQQRFLTEVLKRAMTREQIIRAGAMLHRHGVRFRVANLLGLPGETFQDMMDTVALNITVKPAFALANIFVPFPGLALREYAIDAGHLDPAQPLPRDYFTNSVLNFNRAEKTLIFKTLCLFPLMVRFPRLYDDSKLRNALYHLPRWLLRVVHDLVSPYYMARWYVVKTPLRIKLLMLLRYLQNL
ncbi:MAG: radical SAM protein [Magnetococcales bacterium]|nr:radical SAM protein [Magnetococcales bacterium]